MLKVHLRTPGVIFAHPKLGRIRTPMTFVIKDKERTIYETLIKVSSIRDFLFENTHQNETKVKELKNKPLKNKPKTQLDLNLSIKQ